MTPLDRILLPASPRIVAYRQHTALWLAPWQADVMALAQYLHQQTATHWLLAEADRYHFLTGLMALLVAGKQVLLPPNTQDGTLDALTQHSHHAYLGEATCTRGGLSIAALLPTLPPSTTPPGTLDAHATMTLMTSGSTGTPKAINKTVAQLAAELHSLEQQWGNALSHCTVLSTVPHQHIYGLLFSLLWPLCSGRPFVIETCAYPETLIASMQQYPRALLVSSPAQLSRFPLNLFADQTMPLCKIFSSGGFLANDTALAWRAGTGITPTEVLGSTETGGVAWREQDTTTEQDWQPLPDVLCRCDEDQLCVSSPWFSPNRFLPMGDRARHTVQGRFLLLGRADRIVKVMEKRVSLDALEHHLQQHEGVQTARVLLLPNQDRLAAVVVPNANGHALLQHHGKRHFTEQLRTHLLQQTERVTLPRRWRFPTALPINDQGKTTEAHLLALFQPTVTHPYPGVTFTQEHKDDTQQRWRIAFATDASVFDGHFPDLPILPGVIQLDIAVRTCTPWHPLQTFRRIEKLKFQEPAVPGDSIALHLKKTTANTVAFHYTLDERTLSSGVLVFQSDT